jgi:hypothetical protein
MRSRRSLGRLISLSSAVMWRRAILQNRPAMQSAARAPQLRGGAAPSLREGDAAARRRRARHAFIAASAVPVRARATQARLWPKLTCDVGASRRRERLNGRWLPRSASTSRAEPLADALPVMQPAKDGRGFCASAG